MPLTAKRVFKQFRYAMYFNGKSYYVRLSPPPVSSAYTGMVWMNSLGSTGNVQNAFRWNCLSLINVGWIDPSYRTLDVFAYDKYILLADPNTVRGQWIHISSVVIDNQALYGYLNASLKGSVSIGTTTKPTSRNMYVGAEDCPGYPYYFFYGYVAQVLLYTRALSDSEVQWNYSYPDNPVRNGLVLWLKADPSYVKDIDNDGILEWIDLSGYNNHGKIYGATLVQLIKTSARVLKPARILKPVR